MIHLILQQLAQAPALLHDLVEGIPPELHKQHRIPGKWCIHEHACHLADVHSMMITRFEQFKKEEHPAFVPFLPGQTISDHHLMDMDLQESLLHFAQDREQLLNLLNSFTDTDWAKTATHPEYTQFTAKIFARHIMMHDHLHMYRIEELWLTEDAYLPNQKA